jgi:hypothetical protein
MDLDPNSCLDFGHVYTVEHNLKVRKIGRIDPHHVKRLNTCFDSAMALNDSDSESFVGSDIPQTQRVEHELLSSGNQSRIRTHAANNTAEDPFLDVSNRPFYERFPTMNTLDHTKDTRSFGSRRSSVTLVESGIFACDYNTSIPGWTKAYECTASTPTGKYICTFCKLAFSRKAGWERDEESNHDPETYWTCMLADPAVQRNDDWHCAFCDCSSSNRHKIVEHLKKHKFTSALINPRQTELGQGKLKLKMHLQQGHSLTDSSHHWESWSQPAGRKGAWGCGFCGACSFTWKVIDTSFWNFFLQYLTLSTGRLHHIAYHYENQSIDISQWSLSLVIKGLLKQFRSNFNIAKAWKEVIGPGGQNPKPACDRLLEWPNGDATLLKRQLEYPKAPQRSLQLKHGDWPSLIQT